MHNVTRFPPSPNQEVQLRSTTRKSPNLPRTSLLRICSTTAAPWTSSLRSGNDNLDVAAHYAQVSTRLMMDTYNAAHPHAKVAA